MQRPVFSEWRLTKASSRTSLTESIDTCDSRYRSDVSESESYRAVAEGGYEDRQAAPTGIKEDRFLVLGMSLEVLPKLRDEFKRGVWPWRWIRQGAHR